MGVGIWEIMAPPFFECLILVGIHSYLGLHVIRRKVIFVDLALAQIAALGSTVGLLFGILPETLGAYIFSIGFTLIGAAVFSLSRLRHEKIPQEAVIGLTYAVAASVAILVIDKAPQGAEHIKEIISGNILWVKWSTIIKAATIYALVGIFHFIFRRQFILISENPDKAYERGMSIRLWDFLFYVSFGIIITHSVGTAGVLLVFVFLVVPAIVSTLLAESWWKQLLIGWILGLLVTMVGLLASYQLDLPSGPTVVATYAVMLVAIVLIVYIRRAKEKVNALLRLGLGILITAAVVTGFIFIGNLFTDLTHDKEHDTFMTEEGHLLHEVQVHKKLDTMTEQELSAFLKEIKNIDVLNKIMNTEEDTYLKIKITERIVDLNPKFGLEKMFALLKTCDLPFLREEIIQAFKKLCGQDFGYNSSLDSVQNKRALEKINEWLMTFKK